MVGQVKVGIPIFVIFVTSAEQVLEVAQTQTHMSQTLPIYSVLSYAVPNLHSFEQSEKIEVVTFLQCTDFLLLGMKAY